MVSRTWPSLDFTKILPCRTGRRIFLVKLHYQENLSVRMSGPRRNKGKINQWYFAEKEGFISKTFGFECKPYFSLLSVLPGNHKRLELITDCRRLIDWLNWPEQVL